MTKVVIKNENITSFGGIYHIMDVFSKLGFEKLTESVLGKRGSSGKAFCYGSIFGSLFFSYLCGGRSSHWKRQAGWKPLSCILSACRQNGCVLESRTFWTYIQIKPTTLKSSLNKHHFFWFFILPHWFVWGILWLCKNQEPQKIPISMDKSQKNVTSIYKSTSQGIILRN